MPSEEANVFEQEGIIHVLERTSFPFTEGYLAAENILQFDLSVFQSSSWAAYIWEAEVIHWMMEHEYTGRVNQKDVFVVYEKVVIPARPGRFTHTDAEAAYHYHQEWPESVAPSLQSPAASPALSSSDNAYVEKI